MGKSFSKVLLEEVFAERSDAIIFELDHEAAVRVSKSFDIVAHFVLSGEILIEVDCMESPLTIRTGEYALLMYGNNHRICAYGGGSSKKEFVIQSWPTGDDEPAQLKLGGGRPAAKFISAALRSVYSPVSIQSHHPLSEVLHLVRGGQPTVTGTALFANMSEICAACHGEGASAFVNALMNLHLFQAMRAGYQETKSRLPLIEPVSLVRSPTIRPIAVAVRLLRMHPERCWTVADLAREVDMSRSAMAAHFSACVGVAPMEYLTSVRMEKAVELLQGHHGLSLCAVAKRVGYHNINSFIRAFKAHFGMPPKAFSANSGACGTGKESVKAYGRHYSAVANIGDRRSVEE